jgi:plastocyanin
MAFALGLLGAACAKPPQATVELGSGIRFVPEVADSIDNAGAWASVAVTSDGQPYVAYFGFPETLPEGQTANPRPIGLPSVPDVLLATVHDGIWTRGAIAMAAPISNVNVAFDPATDKIVGDLTKDDVTGLDLAIDPQGGLHAAWGSSSGLFYQAGSGDPSSTTPWTLEKVSSVPPTGLSLAVDDQGNPWISFYGQGKSGSDVDVAHLVGSKWVTQPVAPAQACSGCTTGIAVIGGQPLVAFSDGGNGVSVASPPASPTATATWTSTRVDVSGGQGLSMAAGQSGSVDLAYYAGTTVKLASGQPNALQGSAAASVGDGSATAPGARTSLAVDGSEAVVLGWYDATKGEVAFGSGKPGEQVAPIDVGDSTAGGQFPSVGVAPNGSPSYLAWHAPATGPAVGGLVPGDDLLLGTYGNIQGLGLAIRSPTPTAVAPVTTGPTGGGACAEAKGGKITVVAQGIAFDTNCIQEPANAPLTISFDNKDTGTQHNIEIYTADPTKDPSAKPVFQPPGGATITGPATTTYDVNPLKSGDYHFFCVVHPTLMFGTFRVT